MSRRPVQLSATGFSTVELLVSLVVAALFLFAGYSFYNSILRFSTDSRSRARADLIAQEYPPFAPKCPI
jgi:type II secretory pathway component PulJ